MKKLIIALAAVALAIGAQASCCAWQFKMTTAATGLEGSSVYIVLGDYGGTAPTFADANAIKSASWDGNAVATTTKTKPSYSTSATGTIDSSSLTTSAPNYYMVVVNGDGKGYWVSDVVDATPNLYEPGSAQAGTLQVLPSSIAFANFSGTEPTPEPTSGLLLLMGVAGLALKRKRA